MLGPDFWRRYFKVYDVLNLLPTYRELVNTLCSELDPKEGELVLDVGSGTGNVAQLLRGRGCRVVALDYCREALECHRGKDGECPVVLGDLRGSLPFPDDCFDKIGSNNTLYTLTGRDQVYALGELHRVLKPGGKIALANPMLGWNPMRIYVRGLGDNVRNEGIWMTVRKASAMVLPTAKILHYNSKLVKESEYHYFERDGQKTLLEAAGFRGVSDTKLVYADQAVLNSAYK
jgi:ubiquinone/menaquinone biosynthesis C-methylase UbiE